MQLLTRLLPVIVLLCAICTTSVAQDSSMYAELHSLPDKLFEQISKKSARAEQQLVRQTEKYLNRIARQEHKLQKQLRKKDSTAAEELFGDVDVRYASLQNAVAGNATLYCGHLDSMQTALRFLEQHKLMNGAGNDKMAAALRNYKQLQQKFNHTSDIKKYLKERQQYLKQQLEKFGLTKELKKFQRQAYYYRTQVDEYKRTFEDPSKLEAKLLQLANSIPAFRNFFSRHSMLASMFRLPGNDPSATTVFISGLQTRASIQQSMLQRFGAGPDVSRTMQQNIQSAQSQINQLKNKVSQLGGGSSDTDMPVFKPNKQRTKSFWNRIELGANMQSTKSSSYFPVTSDIALTAGYKLNNRATAGIGASYKVGWGQNFRNLKVTHEGVGIRSFFDVQLKSSFYTSGGFEYNYQQPFNSMQQLRKGDSWQQSGLIGISKVVAVRSKLFNKTKVQLLWDFLSYDQLPRSQPVKFRIGYSFK